MSEEGNQLNSSANPGSQAGQDVTKSENTNPKTDNLSPRIAPVPDEIGKNLRSKTDLPSLTSNKAQDARDFIKGIRSRIGKTLDISRVSSSAGPELSSRVEDNEAQDFEFNEEGQQELVSNQGGEPGEYHDEEENSGEKTETQSPEELQEKKDAKATERGEYTDSEKLEQEKEDNQELGSDDPLAEDKKEESGGKVSSVVNEQGLQVKQQAAQLAQKQIQVAKKKIVEATKQKAIAAARAVTNFIWSFISANLPIIIMIAAAIILIVVIVTLILGRFQQIIDKENSLQNITPSACLRSNDDAAYNILQNGVTLSNGQKLATNTTGSDKAKQSIFANNYTNLQKTALVATANIIQTGKIEGRKDGTNGAGIEAKGLTYGKIVIPTDIATIIEKNLREVYATKDASGNPQEIVNNTFFDYDSTVVNVSGLNVNIDTATTKLSGTYSSRFSPGGDVQTKPLTAKQRNELYERWPGEGDNILTNNGLRSERKLAVSTTVKTSGGGVFSTVLGFAINPLLDWLKNVIKLDIAKTEVYSNTYYDVENLKRKYLAVLDGYDANDKSLVSAVTFDYLNEDSVKAQNLISGYFNSVSKTDPSAAPVPGFSGFDYDETTSTGYAYVIKNARVTGPDPARASVYQAQINNGETPSIPEGYEVKGDATLIKYTDTNNNKKYDPGEPQQTPSNEEKEAQTNKLNSGGANSTQEAVKNSPAVKSVTEFADGLNNLGKEVQVTVPLAGLTPQIIGNKIATDLKKVGNQARSVTGISGNITVPITVNIDALIAQAWPLVIGVDWPKIDLRWYSKSVVNAPGGDEFARLYNKMVTAVIKSSADPDWQIAVKNANLTADQNAIGFNEALGINAGLVVAAALDEREQRCENGQWSEDQAGGGAPFGNLYGVASCKSWQEIVENKDKVEFKEIVKKLKTLGIDVNNDADRVEYYDALIALSAAGAGITANASTNKVNSQRIIASLMALGRYGTKDYTKFKELNTSNYGTIDISKGLESIGPILIKTFTIATTKLAETLTAGFTAGPSKAAVKVLELYAEIAETYGGLGKLPQKGLDSLIDGLLGKIPKLNIAGAELGTDVDGQSLLLKLAYSGRNGVSFIETNSEFGRFIEAYKADEVTGNVYYGRGIGWAGLRGKGVYKKIAAITKNPKIIDNPNLLNTDTPLAVFSYIYGVTNGFFSYDPLGNSLGLNQASFEAGAFEKTKKNATSGKIEKIPGSFDPALTWNALSPDDLKGFESWLYGTGGGDGAIYDSAAGKIRKYYEANLKRIEGGFQEKVLNLCGEAVTPVEGVGQIPIKDRPTCVTQPFDYPGFFRIHTGYDLRDANRAGGGQEVLAYPVYNGVIEDLYYGHPNVPEQNIGGNIVAILTPISDPISGQTNYLRTRYLHLKPNNISNLKKGDKVSTNTPIGVIGNSGTGEGGTAHLHIDFVTITNNGKTYTLAPPSQFLPTNKLKKGETVNGPLQSCPGYPSLGFESGFSYGGKNGITGALQSSLVNPINGGTKRAPY
jgi:murein DD-endopeptidase MepM/ murein hydrolase activator NlpD